MRRLECSRRWRSRKKMEENTKSRQIGERNIGVDAEDSEEEKKERHHQLETAGCEALKYIHYKDEEKQQQQN